MKGYLLVFDILIVVFWVITYLLILISTVKNKYPCISPLAQIPALSLEISICMYYFVGQKGFNYIVIGYILFSVLELTIIFVAFKRINLGKEKINKYFLLLLICIFLMCFLIRVNNGILYFNYVNTIIAMTMWLFYIVNPNYVFDWINLSVFISKTLGDLSAMIVYFNYLNPFVSLMTVLLPILDLIFIIIWFKKFCHSKSK